MKAMILAAGRGSRMRPLTDTCPKPMLVAGVEDHAPQTPLTIRKLEEQLVPLRLLVAIEALVAAGFNRIVINHAWLGDQLEAAVGDGAHWGIRIAWSREGEALETAGGIATAIPSIDGDGPGEPFLVVSADIHSDYDYTRLVPIVASIRSRYPAHAAHLVLVDNPPWHPDGDMALVDGFIARRGEDPAVPALTYANIAVFHPRCFDDVPMWTKAPLFPWAYELADARRMTGTVHDGQWDNVGTPEQLAALDRRLTGSPDVTDSPDSPDSPDA